MTETNMKIITDYQNCPADAKNSIIALGNFDGVHKGHREIIKFITASAKKNGIPSAVMTFEPHPVSVFKPEVENFRLTTLEQKAELLADLGIDFLFVNNFNHQFAQISAEDFVHNILVDSLQVKHITIGYDFIFGHNRGGNAALLKELSQKYKYQFTQVEAISDNEEVFSSTRIREALSAGDLAKAKSMLGRNYSSYGIVARGDNRGKSLGFPTINVNTGDLLLPHMGVYAVKVKVNSGKKVYSAVANIGTKPTFNGTKTGLEVHIFDFDKDIYGANVEIEFIEYIRAEKKFDSIELLKSQISTDCVKAREILQ
jgi:riboflavin kinase/FMN adenylyltransferase